MADHPDWLLQAEDDVLACLLTTHDGGVIGELRGLLPFPEMFVQPEARILYGAMLNTLDRGEPLVVATLLRELDGRDVAVWAGDVLDRSAGTPSTAKAVAKLMADAAKRREVAAQATRLAKLANDPSLPVTDLVAKLVSDLMGTVRQQRPPTSFNTTLVRVLEGLEHDAKTGVQTAGLSSGLEGLDRLTDGLMPGDLAVLAARPSEGKTSLGLQLARIAAETGPVFFASREMSDVRLAKRLLQREVGKNLRALRDPAELDRWAVPLARAAGVLSKLALSIDVGANTPAKLRFEAQGLQAREGLSLIVVDYLQLLDADSKESTRDREIGVITKALKAVATDLNVPLVLLSQLTRASGREQRPPELYDLRDSGNIEQDTDHCWMLHWPEGRAETGPTAVDLYVRKNRDGDLGKVPLLLETWTGQWREAQRYERAA